MHALRRATAFTFHEQEEYFKRLAQSLNKTDFYTNTGNISNPLMILAVMENLSPNERMILFLNFVTLALNLNADHAR